MIETIAILGTGLIGGSMGLTWRQRRPSCTIIGYDRPEVLEQAEERGAITDKAADPATAAERADLVVLATPIGSVLQLMGTIAPHLNDGTLVTDVASVKGPVLDQAQEVLPDSVRFLGGHPMAGAEHAGIAHASPLLFENAAYVLAPLADQDPASVRDEFGDLLEWIDLLGARPLVLDARQHDAIAESDQGRSFQAFWDFLMSPSHQEELTRLLERVIELEPVAELRPDPKLRRIHYDWMSAGEVTQRTVARLSSQLRRYLDDQAWLENRRIMEILGDLERHALAVRAEPPEAVMELDQPAPRVELPLDRPLFTPPLKPEIDSQNLTEGDADIDASALFEQVYIDRERLRQRLRQLLQTRSSISLADVLQQHPLEHGLAELVAWLSLATGEGLGVVDEARSHAVEWTDGEGHTRRATLPVVIFTAREPQS